MTIPRTARRILGFPRRVLSGAKRLWLMRRLWDDAPAALRFVRMTMRMDEPCADRFSFRYKEKTFVSRPMDWCGLEEILLEGEYDFIDGLLKDRKEGTVVDLGANVGLFSLFCSTLNPNLDVHSVEADPDTFDVLKANRDASGSPRWSVSHCAVAGKDGVLRFRHEGVSTAGRLAAPGEEGRDVPAVRWPTLLSRINPKGRIVLLKVDIEGAEGDVLCGPADDFAQVDFLVAEVHPNRCDADAVIGWMRRTFPYLYEVLGRTSSKPLLLAARAAVEDRRLRVY